MPDPANLQKPVDLNDPAILRAQLLDIAGGLELQATASDGGTASAGISNAPFFFRRAASVARAAAAQLEPAPVEPAAVMPTPEPAKPAPAVAKKEPTGAK